MNFLFRLYESAVTYIRGSPLDERVLLGRAKAPLAKGCFIFASKTTDAILTSDVFLFLFYFSFFCQYFDSLLNDLFRYFAVKYARPNIRVVIQLTEGSSHAFPLQMGDTVFYPSEIRSALSSANLAVPGVNTLVSNLLTNISIDDLHLSSENTWEKEYADGMDKESYIFSAPDSFAGMTFAEAALALYDEHKAILVAANVPLKDDTKKGYKYQVILNPSCFVLKKGTILYAIASDNQFIVSLLSPKSDWNPIENVRNIAGGVVDEAAFIPQIFWRSEDHHNQSDVEFRPIKESDEVEIVEDDVNMQMVGTLTASLIDPIELKHISLSDCILKQIPSSWSNIYAISPKLRDFDDVIHFIPSVFLSFFLF